MAEPVARDRFAFFERRTVRWVFGGLLVGITVINAEPRNARELVYFLWSCDALSILLGIAVIVGSRAAMPIITIIVFSSAVDFAYDFVLMLLGMPGPRTEWMRQVERGSELATSIVMHFLLIGVSVAYCLRELRRIAAYPLWRHVVVFVAGCTYTALEVFPIYWFTRPEDNINYVFRSWTGEVRGLAGVVDYYLGYVYRLGLATLILAVVAILVARWRSGSATSDGTGAGGAG